MKSREGFHKLSSLWTSLTTRRRLPGERQLTCYFWIACDVTGRHVIHSLDLHLCFSEPRSKESYESLIFIIFQKKKKFNLNFRCLQVRKKRAWLLRTNRICIDLWGGNIVYREIVSLEEQDTYGPPLPSNHSLPAPNSWNFIHQTSLGFVFFFGLWDSN